jgi:lipoprotein-anchoring transpeptidase ErfK/SrfK
MNKWSFLLLTATLAVNLHAQEPSPTPVAAPDASLARPVNAMPEPAASAALAPAGTPVPMTTPEPSASPSNEPQAAKAEPVNPREIVTRLQIFLDQQNFGPGKIDGGWGEFTGKALANYAKVHGLAVDATIYDKLDLKDLYPIYTQYTISPEDLKWIGPVSSKPSVEAKFKKLLYGDLLEFVAERYHSDPDFLRKLNPGLNLDNLKTGDTVRVPNVAPFKIEDIKEIAHLPEVAEFKQRHIEINRKEHMLKLFDKDQLLAAFPITPGSDRTPTPIGDWHVVGITILPTFRWDEGVLEHGIRTKNFFNLPAGPNNPVGIAWIALSKPGIGMHGTNNPDTIGRAASHGCMRLANWDAVRLAHLVTSGVKVHIQ